MSKRFADNDAFKNKVSSRRLLYIEGYDPFRGNFTANIFDDKLLFDKPWMNTDVEF